VTHADRRRGLVVAVDVAAYGGLRIARTESVQRRLTNAVDEVHRRLRIGTDPAPGAAYLHARAPSGDKLVDLICGGREDEIVAGLVLGLANVLRADNDSRTPDARMRVRVAVDQGVAGAADLGLTGADAVLACRLCDAAVGRAVLAADPGADVVALLSPEVYATSVLDGAYGLWPEHFVEVREPAKTTDLVTELNAWLTVPYRPVPAPPTTGGTANGPRPTPPADGPVFPAAGLVLPDGPLPPAGPYVPRGDDGGQAGGGPRCT
jgi:hypothetical protein